MQDPVKRSLLGLHFTVALLGGTALFSQIIDLPALDITLGRSLFALAFLFALLKFGKDNFTLDASRDYVIAIVLGGIMALHWITYFAAMQYAGVSVGIIALFTFPVITVFLEPLFEKNSLRWQDVISALVVLLGIAFIVPAPDLGNDTTLGVIVGVFSAVLYSMRNLLHRKYFSHYSGVKAMFWQTLVICAVLLLPGYSGISQASSESWIALLVLGTLFTALPHALIAHSLIHLRAATFSLIAAMQPFYGVLLSVIILNESVSWQTMCGGIFVTAASLYETVIVHRKPNR